MKNILFVRAAAAFGFASLTWGSQAADLATPIEAFASHPSYCAQFQGGEQQAGDALDAGYAASLSAGLSASMGGNSKDVEAGLRSVASACAASLTTTQAKVDTSAPK
jgi:hypothetical protein